MTGTYSKWCAPGESKRVYPETRLLWESNNELFPLMRSALQQLSRDIHRQFGVIASPGNSLSVQTNSAADINHTTFMDDESNADEDAELVDYDAD